MLKKFTVYVPEKMVARVKSKVALDLQIKSVSKLTQILYKAYLQKDPRIMDVLEAHQKTA